jgi:cyclomaltodextrin glucanotransferase
MEYVNSNLWFAEIPFDQRAGQTVAYKFVFLHADPNSAPGRENRTGRTRPVPLEGVSKWRDVWEE